MLDRAFLCGLAVVHRCLNLWSDQCHLGDYALDLNQLVDKIGFESSGCNVVPADVSSEVHVVGGDLRWELEIAALRCCLLRVLTSIFLL